MVAYLRVPLVCDVSKGVGADQREADEEYVSVGVG